MEQTPTGNVSIILIIAVDTLFYRNMITIVGKL